MFAILHRKPLLADDSKQWLFDAFAWALRNFNAQVFYTESVLVTPTNAHFPGRENSVYGMAHLIFEQVKEYAGLKHWLCRLIDSALPVPDPQQAMLLNDPSRGVNNIVPLTADENQLLSIPYNPHQVTKPEVLIASFSHILSHYLGGMVGQLPPGGAQYWPQATDLTAIFMGFGIMFANSAYTYRGGCGGSYNPLAERTAYLSEDEATYALAIFCALKDIPSKAVLRELKSYLRPVFKKAFKEISKEKVALAALAEYRLADVGAGCPTSR